MQHLANSGKPGFVHAWGTGTEEDEKEEVQMGAEKEEKEPERSNCGFKQGRVTIQRTT